LIGDSIEKHVSFAKNYGIRSVWYYHQRIPKTEIDLLKSRGRSQLPDFTIINFATLHSLLTYSATADCEHVANGGSLDSLPS
jgi:hypothetical protein